VDVCRTGYGPPLTEAEIRWAVQWRPGSVEVTALVVGWVSDPTVQTEESQRNDSQTDPRPLRPAPADPAS